MREPEFWWQKSGRTASMLSPVAAIYGTIAASRMARGGERADVPVICAGNLTLGGTGKTPSAIAIARMLQKMGETPAFLSRGYGGKLPGPVAVESTIHNAADVGDEPLLLARAARAIVARDRPQGAALAIRGGASVIVMDDGLQNPSLVKDAAIAVIDARRGIGNGRVFPAGPLRAPLDAQLEKVDALLVIGRGGGADPVILAAPHLPIFRGTLTPDPQAAADLAGKRILAFAGIGDPHKFFATLESLGITIPVRSGFFDHHRYTAHEAAMLLKEARENDLTLVTTEKDAARMAGEPHLAELARETKTLPVTLTLERPEALSDWLARALREARKRRGGTLYAERP